MLNDIAIQLGLNKPVRHVHGFSRPNLYYQVEACADEEMKRILLVQALRQTPTGRILIYCGTRRVTEEVAEFLQENFEGVGFYHAGISGGARTKTQNAYTAGELRILVATNAFGMGIDQPNVRLVVHFQMPSTIDALYQEMGRAGRDGLPSTCLMLYSKKDKGLQSYFIDNSDAPKAIKSLRWRNLEALVNYSEGSECRHSEVLTYYKDSQRIQKCGHCDSCDAESARRIQKPAKAPTLTKMRKISKKNKSEVVMDPSQEIRFEALRKWRKSKAAELDVPAFVVFSDQTLRQLAIRNPQRIEDLEDIHGIGETKLEKFGWDLLAELEANG